MTPEERQRAEVMLSKFKDAISIKDYGLALIVMNNQIKYIQSLELPPVPVETKQELFFCSSAKMCSQQAVLCKYKNPCKFKEIEKQK